MKGLFCEIKPFPERSSKIQANSKHKALHLTATSSSAHQRDPNSEPCVSPAAAEDRNRTGRLRRAGLANHVASLRETQLLPGRAQHALSSQNNHTLVRSRRSFRSLSYSSRRPQHHCRRSCNQGATGTN